MISHDSPSNELKLKSPNFEVKMLIKLSHFCEGSISRPEIWYITMRWRLVITYSNASICSSLIESSYI